MNRLSTLTLAACLVGFSGLQCYGQYVVNFTTQYGNTDVVIGNPMTITDLNSNPLLVITGRSEIDDSQATNFSAPANYPSAYIAWDGNANEYIGGLGIHPDQFTSSTGINGTGSHRDEEITFSYTGGVRLNTISLTINNLNGTDDDPVLWINTLAGQFLIDEAAILGAATAAGATGEAAETLTIDFTDFAATVGGTHEVVTSFTLRETAGNIWIKETEFGFAIVPEPSSALLGTIGTMIMLARRRRS